ncbi:MAG: polyprenyl synthetase family protein [Candidatus Aminicenantes bacterium]|nr:MAG: polyprenyl synthetase family protein [Candidatus Aminicenantes bacterium]
MNDYIMNLTTKVDESLVKGLNPENGVLEAAVHYALSVKGKRLRPLLFLTLLHAYKLNPLDYLEIAGAIECIHTYSLIHDDHPCMDDDDFRRGMPTVHKKFDDAIALLAGDTLLTYAFEKIAAANIEPKKIVNILRILTVGIGKKGMAGGQALDLEFNGNKNIIFTIHRMKTAELIKSTLLSAAEIIGMIDKEKEILGEAGQTIGLGFQMADDLLDIIGDEKEVGKKLKKDQGNQSPNCILFYGEEYIKKEIDAAYNKTMTLLKQLNIDFPPFLYLMEKMVYRSK